MTNIAHPKVTPRIALSYFTLKTLLLYSQHAIVLRLLGRDIVILLEI